MVPPIYLEAASVVQVPGKGARGSCLPKDSGSSADQVVVKQPVVVPGS